MTNLTKTNLTTNDLTSEAIEAAGLLTFNKGMRYSDEGRMLRDNSYGVEVYYYTEGKFSGQEWRKFDVYDGHIREVW